MSVANILEDPAVGYKKIDQMWYNAGGGPPPVGLYLPLAGGTMDAFPAGQINAHTLNEVVNITGASAGPGNDTVIQTINGNDLSLQTQPTESITANTGQFEIDAQIRTEINSVVVVQPVGGYTYPNNPERGLEITDWNNPVVGNTMTALEISKTKSGGEANGIFVVDVKNDNGADSYGVRVEDVGLVPLGTSSAFGLSVSNINGNGVAQGGVFSGMTADSLAKGVAVDSITANVGDALGVDVVGITGNTTATGVNIVSTTATTASAFGINIDNVSANNADATGVSIQNVSALNSTTTGINVNNVAGLVGGAYGAILQGVNATDGAGGGSEAIGCRIAGINGDGDTIGADIFKILSADTAAAIGVRISDCRGIGPVGGGDAVGVSIDNVRDENGVGNSWGVRVNKISNPSAGSQSFGVDVSQLANKETFGVRVNDVNGKQIGHGVSITDTKGDLTESVGVSVINTTSVASEAYGVKVDKVDGFSRTYGVYIGSNLSSSGGGAVIGFRQEGAAGQKVINGFDGETRAGAAEDANTGISLQVQGNMFGTAQLINNPGQQIIENGGNFVVVQDIGGSYNVGLPSANVKEGHWFVISNRSAAGNITFDAGGGILVNGGINWSCPAIPSANDYRLLNAFYTSVAGVGEWNIG
jgi:hypothetical protein